MLKQEIVEMMLGTARFQPYLAAANGDLDKAVELYLWSAEISGVVHTQISFVEIAVRNALDPVLAEWNDAQGPGFSRAWTAPDETAPLLYQTIRGPLLRARKWAISESYKRPQGHPRKGAVPTHDDVVVQLTFGTWATLIHGVGSDNEEQSRLWAEVTHQAFAFAEASEASRKQIGKQLHQIHALRNRVAHHDNLLQVAFSGRLNGMLAILAKIHPNMPEVAMARSSLRRLIREDPRRNW